MSREFGELERGVAEVRGLTDPPCFLRLPEIVGEIFEIGLVIRFDCSLVRLGNAHLLPVPEGAGPFVDRHAFCLFRSPLARWRLRAPRRHHRLLVRDSPERALHEPDPLHERRGVQWWEAGL